MAQDNAVAALPPNGRILIIKPSSLGDVVHALPVLAALRAARPDAHVAWLVSNSFAPLLEGHPMLDEVIRFDRARYGRMLRSPRIFAEFLRFVRQIRRRDFDLVIDLQGLIRSGFLAGASGAATRIGFAEAREGAWLFYNRRVRCPADVRHAVDRNLCVARELGLTVDTPQFPLGLRETEVAAARERLAAAAGGPLESFTAVVPGARWRTKLWRSERLAELIDRMHAADLPRCVLLGSPADRELTDEIVADCRSGPIDLVGSTGLRDLVAILSLAERVVCHDSGPMHIAAALGRPITAIFGPTDPRRVGPYDGQARVVATDIECAPCGLRSCWHHSCMNRLEVAEVLKQVHSTPTSAVVPASNA
jgi:lipopolysaccharide heptosyltransferase I